MGQTPLPGSSTASYGSGRRVSMHDAALDVLQSTYPAPAPQPSLLMPQPQVRPNTLACPTAPHIYTPDQPPHGTKGKETAYHRPSNDVQVPIQTGFTYRKGIGYVCVACGRLCPQPGFHHTTGGGGGCVDLGMSWRDSSGEVVAPVAQVHTLPPHDSVAGTAVHTTRANERQVHMQSGFAYRKGLGYACVACGRLCPQPGFHHTVAGGGGCVDLGMSWRDSSGEVVAPVAQAHVPPHDSMAGTAVHTTQRSELQPPAPGRMATARMEIDEGRRLSEVAGLFF